MMAKIIENNRQPPEVSKTVNVSAICGSIFFSFTAVVVRERRGLRDRASAIHSRRRALSPLAFIKSVLAVERKENYRRHSPEKLNILI